LHQSVVQFTIRRLAFFLALLEAAFNFKVAASNSWLRFAADFDRPEFGAYMNITAECRNGKCKLKDKPQSVAIGTLMGYGTGNERVICPECGEIMTTTKKLNSSKMGRDQRRNQSRYISRRNSGRR
jgi:hypothetical protein